LLIKEKLDLRTGFDFTRRPEFVKKGEENTCDYRRHYWGRKGKKYKKPGGRGWGLAHWKKAKGCRERAR